MTFTVGHVQGGTNAGRRRIKPSRAAWFCGCFERDTDDDTNAVKVQQPGWRPECPDCGEKRPK